MKFRKKPVVIEAVQWDGDQFVGDVPAWIGNAINQGPGSIGALFRWANEIQVFTLEGVMAAKPGDWIIKGIKGELYPCKPDIFEATYEPAEQPDLPTIIDPPGGEAGH